MRKCEELIAPHSCLNKAKWNELLFVLLGRDPAAPATIRYWIAERLRLGKNKPEDEQIREARLCSEIMAVEQCGADGDAWNAIADRHIAQQVRPVQMLRTKWTPASRLCTNCGLTKVAHNEYDECPYIPPAARL